MFDVMDRLLNYVKFNTKSKEDMEVTPSTKGQLILAEVLKKELTALGLEDIKLSENSYLEATLPKNVDKKIRTIGFIAHLDTSPDMSGENVKPRIVNNYDGEAIILNEEKNVILSPADFPELKDYIGKTLITTDGTTLLGADDKAGIAEIMAAISYLVNNPQIKHGDIKVCFTPDEEIGHGAQLFDIEGFGAEVAYTIDGGTIGELEYENFNAAYAEVKVNGRNVHPGSAKNKMINSMHIASELINMLPCNERPEFTEGYEGFYHLNAIKGTVEETELDIIIRDFNKEDFEKKKELIKRAVQLLNFKYGDGRIELNLKDQYYNMKEKIEPVKYAVDIAIEAMKMVNIQPNIVPIRGGTDGARLSYMGLPTPNIFTGGHNFHGKYEFIPVESMEKAVLVILKIIQLYSEQ